MGRRVDAEREIDTGLVPAAHDSRWAAVTSTGSGVAGVGERGGRSR